MAEEKKSFILYADLIHTIEKLPNEDAGELFKHILRYVNDKNPTTENILVDVTFEPIKQQLKRDLKAWEGSKEEKSIAGIKGNLKRWNTDLYNKFIAGEMTLDEAQKIAENRRTSQPDNVRSQNIAKVAVNDNVTVTVNDTVNDIKEKEFKKGVPPSFDEFLNHAKEKAKSKNIILDEEKVRTKFDSWLENDWCDLNGKKIINWKVKITSNITYWQKTNQTNNYSTSRTQHVHVRKKEKDTDWVDPDNL